MKTQKTDTPEADRTIKYVENLFGKQPGHMTGRMRECERERNKLRAVNAELLAALLRAADQKMNTRIGDETELIGHVTSSGRCYSVPLEVGRELGNLRAVNAELVAALHEIVLHCRPDGLPEPIAKAKSYPREIARAAIAKAQS